MPLIPNTPSTFKSIETKEKKIGKRKEKNIWRRKEKKKWKKIEKR